MTIRVLLLLKKKGDKTMVIIYLSPSCTSCRKAHAWLEEYNVPFIVRNIISDPPTLPELKKILSLTTQGTDEIISMRSKAFLDLNVDVEDMSLKEVCHLIYDHPEILRKPIIVDERRIQIGYNEGQIRQFVPKSHRRHQLNQANHMLAAHEN